jgi:hypothetical protein
MRPVSSETVKARRIAGCGAGAAADAPKSSPFCSTWEF